MPLERFSQLLSLFDPLGNKMRCVLSRLFARECGTVRKLIILRHIAAGDPVILEPKMPSVLIGMKVRRKVLERGVPADIAVELAINVVPRVTNFRRPDLLARFEIACEYGSAVRRHDRCMNSEP